MGHEKFRVAGQLPPGHEAHLPPAAGPGIVEIVEDSYRDVKVPGKLRIVEVEIVAAGPDVSARGAGIDDLATLETGFTDRISSTRISSVPTRAR